MDMVPLGLLLCLIGFVLWVISTILWPNEAGELESIHYDESEWASQRRGQILRANKRRGELNKLAGFIAVAGFLTLIHSNINIPA